MKAIDRLTNWILRSPLLWGALLAVAFYAPIEAGYLNDPYLVRYTAGHWVEYIEMVMFCVGLAALVIKAISIARQCKTVDLPYLGDAPAGGQPVDQCYSLLERLAQMPAAIHATYLWRRLRSALEYVYRKESADSLDDEIKYLSDVDYVQAAQSYSFVRIIIWAIPILGFLGTVIGITIAIANLSPQQLEESLGEVTSGLGTAFDTTALALMLAMILMFGQHILERIERRLLSKVDERVNEQLVGRFQSAGSTRDPEVIAVRGIAETLLGATEQLIARQAELWQASIEAANHRWQQLAASAGKQLETALAAGLDRSLKSHAAQLTAAEQAAAEQNRQHWVSVQESLLRTAEALNSQQQELTRQGDVLLNVVEATGQVTKLESELNRNLQALAGAKHFEETVLSLAAAVQLLSARVGGNEVRPVQLDVSKRAGQAA